MRDDLDTPTAMAALQHYAREILSAAEKGFNVEEAQRALRHLGAVLGLRLEEDGALPDPDVVEGWDAFLNDFAGTM
jgi:hypothetical protein